MPSAYWLPVLAARSLSTHSAVELEQDRTARPNNWLPESQPLGPPLCGEQALRLCEQHEALEYSRPKGEMETSISVSGLLDGTPLTASTVCQCRASLLQTQERGPTWRGQRRETSPNIRWIVCSPCQAQRASRECLSPCLCRSIILHGSMAWAKRRFQRFLPTISGQAAGAMPNAWRAGTQRKIGCGHFPPARAPIGRLWRKKKENETTATKGGISSPIAFQHSTFPVCLSWRRGC